jgi:hypothetical protein
LVKKTNPKTQKPCTKPKFCARLFSFLKILAIPVVARNLEQKYNPPVNRTPNAKSCDPRRKSKHISRTRNLTNVDLPPAQKMFS